uniref:Uncharacterized protein n=1 Tax=Nelumbo nucifera TaxID=4432 RepID=A0A822XQ53_NELNU|nr:TPA_asm: hypothetical protein HUJ06_021061 [Nelumbo nucifera]
MKFAKLNAKRSTQVARRSATLICIPSGSVCANILVDLMQPFFIFFKLIMYAKERQGFE